MSLLARGTRASVLRGLAVAVVAAATVPAAAAPQKKPTAPEVFSGRAIVAAAAGRGDAAVTIRVDRYSTGKDLNAMGQALKSGGSTAFVHALKQAPVVGRLEVGTQTFAIRWARERET